MLFRGLRRRRQYILREEGLVALVKRIFSFLLRCLLSYRAFGLSKRTYYLYKATPADEAAKARSTPLIPDFSLKTVSSSEEIEQLMADGFDLGWLPLKADEWLKKGVVAFCAFAGRELVHVSWLAMNKQAKDSLDGFTCQVNFSNKEAYLGWTVKNPKHRRVSRSVPLYVYFEIMRFLQERGIRACHFVVGKSKTVSRNTLAKRVPIRPYREGCYLRLFWWKFWKESPLIPGQNT